MKSIAWISGGTLLAGTLALGIQSSSARPAHQGGLLTIEGTVSDSRGRPLDQGWVRWLAVRGNAFRLPYQDSSLDPDSGRAPSEESLRRLIGESHLARISDQGHFRLQIPWPGPIGMLVASAPGYETQVRATLPPDTEGARIYSKLNRGEEVQVPLSLRLAPGGGLSGTVFDRGGRPASRVAVLAGSAQSSRRRRDLFVYTGDDGRYSFSGLPAGRYSISTGTGMSRFAPSSNPQTRSIEVRAGRQSPRIDFQVEVGATLSGRVLDAQGRPLAVRCRISPAAADSRAIVFDRTRREMTSDAEGRFLFAGLPRNRDFYLDVRHGHWAEYRSPPLRIEKGQDEIEHDIVLAPEGIIAGTVAMPDGSPVGRVRVTAQLVSPTDGSFRRSTTSDAAGFFRLSMLPAGRYRLSTDDPRSLSDDSDGASVEVEVHAGQAVDQLHLVIPERRAEVIAGTVVDQDGQPLSDVSLVIRHAGTRNVVFERSDPAGRFEFGNLEKGTYDLTANRLQYSTVRLRSIRSGGPRLNIRMLQDGVISGNVLKPDGTRAEGLGGVIRIRSSMSRPQLENQLKDDGSYRVSAPAGAVRLEVDVPGFSTVLSPLLSVPPGGRIVDQDIRLKPGAAILGRVVGPEGHPLADAVVTALPRRVSLRQSRLGKFVNVSASASTDSQGRYRLLDLKAGAYVLTADHERFARSRKLGLTVGEGLTAHAPDLVVVQGGRLDITLRLRQEAAVGERLWVTSSSPGNGRRTALSDESGRIVFEGLSPGYYQLSAGSGHYQRTLFVKLDSGQAQDLVIDLDGGLSVRGRVIGLDPDASNRLILKRSARVADLPGLSGGQLREMELPADGFFAFHGLSPDDYVLELFTLGNGFPSRERPALVPRLSRTFSLSDSDLRLELDLSAPDR